jgi:hypothetical protein
MKKGKEKFEKFPNFGNFLRMRLAGCKQFVA